MRRRLPVLMAALTLLGSAFVVGTAPNAAAQTAPPEFLTGPANGANPHVVAYDAAGRALGGFMAGSQATGARVASGDVTGDVRPEIIVATGPGVTSQVSIYSLGGAFLGAFSPYGAFAGGVNVAVADVDGDAVSEIATAAGPGGGPHVVVWEWTNGQAVAKAGWYAYAPNFKGGVNVAAFDVVNSGRADVVTAPGAGGGPHVRVWDLGAGGAAEAVGWMAYAPSFTGGVNVGAGAIDGARAVVTAPGPGGGPHVRIFSSAGAVRSEFFAYDPAYRGGVNVIFGNMQGAGPGLVITAPASWGGPHVRGFRSNGAEVFGFMAYGGSTLNGVSLARVPQSGSTNNTNQNGSTSSSG